MTNNANKKIAKPTATIMAPLLRTLLGKISEFDLIPITFTSKGDTLFALLDFKDESDMKYTFFSMNRYFPISFLEYKYEL